MKYLIAFLLLVCVGCGTDPVGPGPDDPGRDPGSDDTPTCMLPEGCDEPTPEPSVTPTPTPSASPTPVKDSKFFVGDNVMFKGKSYSEYKKCRGSVEDVNYDDNSGYTYYVTHWLCGSLAPDNLDAYYSESDLRHAPSN